MIRSAASHSTFVSQSLQTHFAQAYRILCPASPQTLPIKRQHLSLQTRILHCGFRALVVVSIKLDEVFPGAQGLVDFDDGTIPVLQGSELSCMPGRWRGPMTAILYVCFPTPIPFRDKYIAFALLIIYCPQVFRRLI